MKIGLPIWFCVMLVLTFSSCTTPDYQEEIEDPEWLHASMQKLTDIIVHDIFSPPVASRIYAYPSIAAYEILVQKNPDYLSLVGQLNDLGTGPVADTNAVCLEMAAVHAFIEVGKSLIFSEEQMNEFQKELYQKIEQTGIPTKVLNSSIEYGDKMKDHILSWADGDNYKETRSFPKYTIDEDPATWKPTPPAYIEGIEPHWRAIRTFVLDSAQQYIPVPPTEYDMSPESGFYKEVMEVFDVRKNLTEEQKEIASFWDCNPYVMNQVGHVMYATKKITPGGHWMGIASLAAKNSGADMMKTTRTYAGTAIALTDAFISCWDEKYRSNLIRPETLINEYIDESWTPLLQTPPFPEYTSGHSVISNAAAVLLTDIYGEKFAFDDTVEEVYGLPVRSFDSFFDASEEAAISRLYGGIHYMPAIVNGVEQGKKVGTYILEKVQFRTSGE